MGVGSMHWACCGCTVRGLGNHVCVDVRVGLSDMLVYVQCPTGASVASCGLGAQTTGTGLTVSVDLVALCG